MKWTAWDVIRLLLVVAASMAAAMALMWGFVWLVLWLDKVVKSWQGNVVWELFSIVAGVVLIAFIAWGRIVTVILLFKGYSVKQVLFGDAPHRLLSVEARWEARKRKWRRFFARW